MNFIPINSPHNNLNLLNTVYHRAQKNGKSYEDAISLIYKDNETGKKYLSFINKPPYEYFMIKPGEELPDHNLLFIEKDKVDPIIVDYVNLEKDIAERTDNVEFFYNNLRSGTRYENRRLHTHAGVFRSDMDIQDFYRFKFVEQYGFNDMKITKSYLDIEADTINMKGDFPELGECPVNAVTVIDGTSNKVYTLLLRNPDNPLIEQFENKLKTNGKEFFDKLNSLLVNTVGGWKNAKRYDVDNLDFNLFFYDDEIEMMTNLFILINETKPDFVLAWNMAFDIPYIIERLKNLGVDPASVICHPDFPIKECNYYIDERNANEYSERGDKATISSYSVYLDQMIHFASRRKGQSLFKRYSLDAIGTAVAGAKKLDYSHITNDIAKFPYLDYELFVIYNIVDTIVQKCIEVKTDDIGFVYNKSMMNNVRYEKCHRNTIYLKNRGASEFEKDGFVMGNNANIDTMGEKYAGGLVVDPLLLEKVGVQVNGVPTMLLRNAVDYDYKSLYPSLCREFNMGPNTQIGKLIIEKVIWEMENRFNNPDYDRGGAFLEDMISRNFLIIGNRWLKLAGYSDLLKDIIEYMNTIRYGATNYKSPFVIYGKDEKISPFIIDDKITKPFNIYSKYPKELLENDNNRTSQIIM